VHNSNKIFDNTMAAILIMTHHFHQRQPIKKKQYFYLNAPSIWEIHKALQKGPCVVVNTRCSTFFMRLSYNCLPGKIVKLQLATNSCHGSISHWVDRCDWTLVHAGFTKWSAVMPHSVYSYCYYFLQIFPQTRGGSWLHYSWQTSHKPGMVVDCTTPGRHPTNQGW
jgi:hypothetical protein